MRPRHPRQQVGERQGDGDQDAVEDVEGEHTGERGEREQQLAAPEPGQAPEARHIHQPDRGIDDDRAEHGRRESGQRRAQEQQHTDHGDDSDQRVQLAAAAGGCAERGAAAAAAHREAGQEPGTEVGRAEREQLPARVDLTVAGAAGKRPGGQHVVGEPDEQHPESGDHQLGQVFHSRRRRPGQAAGNAADDRDPTRAQIEHRGDGCGQHDGEQRPRRARPAPLEQEKEHQHARGEHDGAHLGRPHVMYERRNLTVQMLARHGNTGRLAQLTDNHDDGDTGQVTDQDRLGEQIGDEPQPHHPRYERQQPDHNRKRRREGRVPARVPRGQRPDGGGCHQRRRRLRADGQLSRGPEHRVDRQRGQRRPQPRHRRQTRDPRIGHHLRHQVGRHRHSGKHVAAQPGAAIPVHPPQRPRHPRYPSHPRHRAPRHLTMICRHPLYRPFQARQASIVPLAALARLTEWLPPEAVRPGRPADVLPAARRAGHRTKPDSEP